MEEVGRQALRATLGLVLLALASVAALAQAKLADLAGRWEVVAVELRANTVQALTVDDPAYMGAVLQVTAGRLEFVVKTGGELDDVCVGARWDGALVGCVVGSFGPPGAALTNLGDRLRLEWYDNALLTLRRVR